MDALLQLNQVQHRVRDQKVQSQQLQHGELQSQLSQTLLPTLQKLLYQRRQHLQLQQQPSQEFLRGQQYPRHK